MSQEGVQTYPIRLRRRAGEKCSLLNFHKEVQIKEWKKVEMGRQNNKQIHNAYEQEKKPMFGPGSTYLQKEREEKRRAKYDSNKKEYKEENQPWLMKVQSDTERHYISSRATGALQNSDYYLFTQNQDGSIDATKITDWHNFTAHRRFKHLEAEEAEEQFTKRDKTFNYFALKIRKNLKAAKGEEEEEKGAEKVAKSDLKVSEMEEWIDSDDDSSEEEEGRERNVEEETKKRKRGKGNGKGKPKRKRWDCNVEAGEDSDDGDEEGREREYISDSSDSEAEDHRLVGVAEEKGLKKLFSGENGLESSDSSSDGESDEEKEKDEEEEEEEKENDEKKKKNATKKKNVLFDCFSSSSDEEKKRPAKPLKEKKSDCKKNSLKPAKEMNIKEKVLQIGLANIHKRGLNVHTSSNSQSTSSVQEVRTDMRSFVSVGEVSKYLARKPITLIDLLRKFKSKGIPPKELEVQVGNVIRKINPKCEFINGKRYYSIP